jgi:anti-sigma factor RsiW
MTHDQSHHEHAQDAFIDALFDESPINIAALLRACADGELNPDQCERLKALLAENPEAVAQHDFEEQLRACCSRSMTKPGCPQALRDRIGAIASSSAADASAEDEAYADRIEGAGAYTASRSFWARSPLMGVAAVLLLSVAGVLIWQSTALVTSSGGGFSQIDPVSYTQRVGNFAAREHTRCCVEEAAQRKFTERDIAQTVSYFSDRFERPVAAPDMLEHAELVEFYGGGDCHVPMTSSSGHLRFDATDSAGDQITMSLFISPDPGLLELEEGVTYRVSSKACDEAGANLFIWVSGGIQYVLVSEAQDETCSIVRSMMNAPEKLSSI